MKLAASIATALLLAPLPAAALTGPARVIDGDTLAIGDVHYRLFGIDAPEHDQPCTDGGGQVYACGQVATDALRAMIGGQPVTCEARDTDRYGRTVATCSTPGAGDLGAAMVRAGEAVAFVRYSKRYLPEQAQAQAARLGLWAGQFVMPWDWRKAR